ncbi:MAG: glyceraldehyde-3-phosphate dehydrogenase/erythrose-4-phosphate dehydrogenase [Crocinitomicaceae bacterium]|jgi:glyceraldehyde-3-phosphate dehydrogenase/erythrose-4-phosphate dehydrogenase
MEKIKLGINGFGRIGRLIFRLAIENGKFEVKNDAPIQHVKEHCS